MCDTPISGTHPLADPSDPCNIRFVVEKRILPRCFLPLLNSMELTQSFPPVDAFIVKVQEIDYKKHLNSFMDAVVIACAFIAAIATVIRDKWVQNDCTERLQLFVLRVIELAKTFYAWVMNVFIPGVKEFANDCRSIYNTLTLQFVK